MQKCPCGSNLEYAACCGPYIEGRQKAQTAEKLLRSRYTAHVLVKTPYIMATVHPDKRSEHDEKSIREWSQAANWDKLEILETRQGESDDSVGFIEFKVFYQDEKGQDIEHHELSEFRKLGEEWFFFKGSYPGKTITRVTPKIGRNEPCPCGSGKKYKKCCGV
ncbi:MAG: hypothetical protein CVV50_01475 [Spirochaetae bacterium HGW-Spirochaetae-6]|nr:MAG: hypothetical protein CVV50_01475 [Spirochaetae bacterium HGW-Spirochaetae-6]